MPSDLFSELHSWEWLGILLARLAVGLLFFLSGRSKLFIPQRREQMRQQLIEAHVPFPEFNAVFVSAVEFICGVLLVLWSTDASRMRAARLRNDYDHYDDRNSQCQSIVASELAVGVFIPS